MPPTPISSSSRRGLIRSKPLLLQFLYYKFRTLIAINRKLRQIRQRNQHEHRQGCKNQVKHYIKAMIHLNRDKIAQYPYTDRGKVAETSEIHMLNFTMFRNYSKPVKILANRVNFREIVILHIGQKGVQLCKNGTIPDTVNCDVHYVKRKHSVPFKNTGEKIERPGHKYCQLDGKIGLVLGCGYDKLVKNVG